MTHHARPHIKRAPLHSSITEQNVTDLVESFYSEVRADERLAPIFANHMEKDWSEHLSIMCKFWRSVLLRTGEYNGRPVPAHQKIDGINEADFEQWLKLFRKTADKILIKDAADLAFAMASNIATSLWLSRNPDPFAQPPSWQTSLNGKTEK